VDLEKYKLPAAPPHQPLRFAMASRLLREKGVVEFADAARIIKRDFPTVDFRLWGILDKSDPRCVNQAEIDKWVNEGIITYGGEATDAIQAFCDASCVVLPSYYPEGVPRTLLEAASMSLPVITTDMPGCRDAVINGKTGFICKPRDAQDLAIVMRKFLCLSEMERQSMGQDAREYMRTVFDENIVLKAYLEEINALTS
jgi:glycosyltransferase involved in cell wall biosynthesis